VDDATAAGKWPSPKEFGDTLEIKLPEQWTFTEFAPSVFKRLRAVGGVDEAEYTRSLSPERVLGSLLLGELATPSIQLSDGKSGSFFYYSYDGRFLLKTVPLEEYNSLASILPAYYKHLEKYPNSLIGRFFGLHKINQTAFVVMENVFQTNLPIHRVYDLKGSSVNRSSGDSVSVKKDMDLQHLFYLDTETRHRLVSQIRIDAELLKSLNLMDYSLLIGIHYMKYPNTEYQRVDPTTKPSVPGEELILEKNPPLHRRDYGGLQAREHDGTPLAEIYFIGIIDILTTYTTMKSAENFVKSLFVNKHAISSVPPDEYATRFQRFADNIFYPYE